MGPNARAQSAPVLTMFRSELIETLTIGANNSQYQLGGSSGNLPVDRFMSGLYLQVRFRVTNPGSGNPTAILADAPFSVLANVTVEGKHRLRRSTDTIVNLSGPELAELARNYEGLAIQRSGTLVTTASAAQDISFVLPVPFVPLRCHPGQMVNYLVDNPNYEWLRLSVRWADEKSLFSGQSTAPTFSAFGSGSGSPSIRVIGQFAMSPATKFAGFVPGVYSRYSKVFNLSTLVSSGSNVRLFDVPRGGKIRAMMLKTGVNATGVSAGNTAFATLSDSILSNVYVNRGLNRSIAEFIDFEFARQAHARFRGIGPSTGYLLHDWSNTGHVESESLSLVDAINGSTGDADIYVRGDVSGASNQTGLVVFEEIVTPPQVIRAVAR